MYSVVANPAEWAKDFSEAEGHPFHGIQAVGLF